MVAVSRAPLENTERYRKRMGWGFKWLSSDDGDFNYDFGASFRPNEQNDPVYNFGTIVPGRADREGVSVFAQDESGRIFRSYSSFARGIDMLNTAYHYLDIVPRGRDEGRPVTVLGSPARRVRRRRLRRTPARGRAAAEHAPDRLPPPGARRTAAYGST